MDRIPVWCVGHNSKRYDGKLWLEPVEDILNGEQLSEPILPSVLNEGDAVKVCQHSKGGRHKSCGSELFPGVGHHMENYDAQQLWWSQQLHGNESGCRKSRPQLQGSESSQSTRRNWNPSLKEWVGYVPIRNYPCGITTSMQMLQYIRARACFKNGNGSLPWP